jgi:UDP-glucose 4-epimerase
MEGCDAALHLAALVAIPYSYHSADTYVDTNVKGTLNVLQAARELGVKRVIHTSTSEVYGTARFVLITEEYPLQGHSPSKHDCALKTRRLSVCGPITTKPNNCSAGNPVMEGASWVGVGVRYIKK